MNVALERKGLERIAQGLPQNNKDKAKEGGEANHQWVISKAFLNQFDKSFLAWKWFSLSAVPCDMKFVAAVLDQKPLPRISVPKIAFLGCSNVGKSSLLNRLSSFANNKNNNNGSNDEARVGKTPGATASVNLYALFDKSKRPLLGLVELPGFGYAKLSKEVQESVQQAAERYLGNRQELVLGILLVTS